jgi:hypothetical protein
VSFERLPAPEIRERRTSQRRRQLDLSSAAGLWVCHLES